MAAVKTINSTTTPYCSASELFFYHDPQQCADMIVDGTDPRPEVGEMLAPGSKYGSIIQRFLRTASGRVESACLIAQMYNPEDLAELYNPTHPANAGKQNSASRETLVKLTADLCFWMLCQRRQPNAGDPRNVQGAVEAQQLLDQLRDGQRIFGFVETEEAGVGPVVQPPNPNQLVTPNVILKAARLLPGYGINSFNGGEN